MDDFACACVCVEFRFHLGHPYRLRLCLCLCMYALVLASLVKTRLDFVRCEWKMSPSFCDTWNVYLFSVNCERSFLFSVEAWSIDLRLLSKGRELLYIQPSVQCIALLKRQPLFSWSKSNMSDSVILRSDGHSWTSRSKLWWSVTADATVHYEYVQFQDLLKPIAIEEKKTLKFANQFL